MPDLLNLLRRVVEAVNGSKDLKLSLNRLTQMVQQGMAVDACTVFLWDSSVERYVLMATKGLSEDAVGQVTLTQNEGMIALVGKREEPLNLANSNLHPNYHHVPSVGEDDFHGLLAVPIIHNRKLLGVLSVQRYRVERFSDEEEAFLVTLSAQLAGIIAHAEATGTLSGMNLMGTQADTDIRFKGVACASGVAIGQGYVISPTISLNSVRYTKTEDIDAELARFEAAISGLRKELSETRQRLEGELRPEELALFDVYAGILDDQAVGGAVRERIRNQESAQSALAETMRGYVRHFEDMEDAYLRERASDMRDLGQRLLTYLVDEEPERTIPEHAVLIGEEISAAVFGSLDPESVSGIVCSQGSANSHLAILARALNIPTVLGAQDIPWQELEGKELVVDGYRGHVYYKLTDDRREYFESLVREEKERVSGLEALADLPAETANGDSVDLMINTGLQTDILRSQEIGADGVGLFRTEIPFMMLGRFPSEEEQAKIYRNQLEAFYPRPVTMRTLDIGGDKSLEYFPIEEDNPFLGWRGLRVTLDHPEIFIVQVRAMLRASLDLNNLSIMLPMVTSVGEVEESLALIHRAVYELNEEGVRVEVPRVGVMIEVPSAVYLVKDFLSLVDFISVGSNDLTQYLLAVDRNNPRVAGIYDSMHPAVLKALKIIVSEGQQAGIPVSVCGELAGDPLGAVTLLGLGYRHLSMSGANLLRVKAVLRQIDSGWAETVASGLLNLDDPKVIRSTLQLALQKAGVPLTSLGLLPSR
ncbi:phosphoenolpyruvate--protein phosphotransferase [Reinekea blandensis]|uniref:phosphoenolpyruvate--protein phosphotransferase n=1 Tax=Reinekea blandensis MED297 TaxID=314283 RepID=A4BAG5_9GAMM|nr:phosphoenolpyruvate--protein phosphotransferase [Reinekea blandensis]EAR10921.1 Signal transduction protein containing GAF and PtsI domains [Reinekea sp. MED297] [Reinekea blandensis MED297]